MLPKDIRFNGILLSVGENISSFFKKYSLLNSV